MSVKRLSGRECYWGSTFVDCRWCDKKFNVVSIFFTGQEVNWGSIIVHFCDVCHTGQGINWGGTVALSEKFVFNFKVNMQIYIITSVPSIVISSNKTFCSFVFLSWNFFWAPELRIPGSYGLALPSLDLMKIVNKVKMTILLFWSVLKQFLKKDINIIKKSRFVYHLKRKLLLRKPVE